MTRKILLTIALVTILMVNPSMAKAQYYGQGEVLGEQAPEEVVHKPVEAGIEDYFNVIGFALLGLSGLFYHISKKTRITYEPVQTYVELDN